MHLAYCTAPCASHVGFKTLYSTVSFVPYYYKYSWIFREYPRLFLLTGWLKQVRDCPC